MTDTVDISDTVAAKSDQLNADDLLGGPRTITVTRVTKPKDPEQPVAIYFEGDGGKPYKPGKSMRRVLLQVWGKDGARYAGQSMTLYRDPEITFGKLKVGGIRISHMTGIDSERDVVLTVKQGQKAAFKVRPLVARQQQSQATAEDARGEIDASQSLDDLREVWRRHNRAPFWPDVVTEFDQRKTDLTPAQSDNGGPDGYAGI